MADIKFATMLNGFQDQCDEILNLVALTEYIGFDETLVRQKRLDGLHKTTIRPTVTHILIDGFLPNTHATFLIKEEYGLESLFQGARQINIYDFHTIILRHCQNRICSSEIKAKGYAHVLSPPFIL